MKNTGSTLIRNLRKFDDEVLVKTATAIDTKEAKKTKTAKKEFQSVLTPIYLGEGVSTKNVMVQCELSEKLREQLPAILAQASPFSAALPLSKLVDLMYCEVSQSEALRDRMAAKVSQYEIVMNGQNRTSVLMPDYIVNYIQEILQARPQKALTRFLNWIVQDWGFIHGKIKMKGLV